MGTNRTSRLRLLTSALLAIALIGGGLVLTLDGCVGRCAGAVVADAQAAGPAVLPPGPVDLVLSPVAGARDVDPLAPVTVTASAGTLVDVVMVNELGKRIDGVLTPDGTVWKPAVPLGYGRSYTVTATGVGANGMARREVSTFSTLVPGNQTRVSLRTTGAAPLREGQRYGVGTVVVAHFDEPITDRAAAERALVVTTTPPVSGAWHWVDDQNAHWRPPQYFSPGTTVTVAADIYGRAVGAGLYGQEDARVTFTIGDAHVSIADDATKQVSVYRNGELVRTMPTSMGMGGSETVNGQTISFWTQRGVYTVLDKANPVIMDSSTFGLPINSRLGYRETISWATRISTDGVYLHQLDSTVWAQGNTNVSHGCLNLSGDNARWFYEFSQPGDIVEIRNTGGDPLQLWQNGDWSMPWPQWVRGSALS
ncbi:L,D-transpeptidase [Mycolicibacterium fluoranthenivorans]|uniref:Lipoprotein-anchoring transpeptidase ErfK/SrfK n=1 Tax=Mycolicibacterium fluoranthenivorans TaxID=258505 RepID=A0A1G4WUF8_9MYCO|nr:Ig-like domain-containing protein [Mycolicibacterium fluoranthenivorans]SCX29771.1 Lipoprotein-anchoring transpeptidase ErfK/SrfK [Mycolicibacterium fluoranthenivorans]